MNIIMKYISFFILLTAFFLISCEKEIDFKGKEEAPRMVLNTIINPNSCIKVFLSESQFFLSTNIYYKNINYAKIYVWRNGEMIEELIFDGKMTYTGNFIPSIGDKIKITAEHPDYPSVESEETEIPATVPLITIDTVDFKYYGIEYESHPARYIDDDTVIYIHYDTTRLDTMYRMIMHSKVKITFNDPERIKNHYRIFVGVDDKYVGERTGRLEQSNSVFCYSNDLVFSNSNMGLASTSLYNEFSDLLFDGETYTLTLCFYVEKLYVKNDTLSYYNNIPDEREITVRLESICESNYKYFSSLSLLGITGNGPFSEPVQIYSNIKGGMGIVGSYSVFRSTIELPQWEKINQDEYRERRNRDYDAFWRMYDRYGLGTFYAPYGYETYYYYNSN